MVTMAKAGIEAFVVVASPMTFNNRAQLAELALKYRLASFFSAKENVHAEGLMSYGPNFDDLARRGANYVTESSRARSLPTCRSSSRPSSSSSSISRPPKRSASQSHRRCSPALTR